MEVKRKNTKAMRAEQGETSNAKDNANDQNVEDVEQNTQAARSQAKGKKETLINIENVDVETINNELIRDEKKDEEQENDDVENLSKEEEKDNMVVRINKKKDTSKALKKKTKVTFRLNKDQQEAVNKPKNNKKKDKQKDIVQKETQISINSEVGDSMYNNNGE
ncbi:binder of USO1 and GRH1 protein 1-like [Solanum lycopersicum]|uniref:binder of USO1 and GRH1 protein 1-like n=1 Tax=Solanum lycopersicum TaxID=4081 RepID=UPI00374A8302